MVGKVCFRSVFKDLTQQGREVTAEQSGSPHGDRRGKRRGGGGEGRIGKGLIEGEKGEQKKVQEEGRRDEARLVIMGFLLSSLIPSSLQFVGHLC